MLFRSYLLVALPSAFVVVVSAFGEYDMGSGMFLQEDVFITPQSPENSEDHNLRRRMVGVCSATTPEVVHGNDCSGTYDCSCGQCEYCPSIQTGTSQGSLCMQTGSSTTFYDKTCNCIMHCTCNIFDDGRKEHECHERIPQPAPTPSPTAANRAPVDGQPTPEVPLPTVEPLAPLGCSSLLPYNPRICLGPPEYCRPSWVNCTGIQYPCYCTGDTSQTECSLCQVQTPTEMICQVTGSWMTVTGLDGVRQSCSCEYAGNGTVIQTCTPVGDPVYTDMP